MPSMKVSPLDRLDRIAKKGLVIMDGGTGSELAKDSPTLWSGTLSLVQLEHPEKLCDVHDAYIASGADVIITNTYCTNGNVLNKLGMKELTEPAILAAVRCAHVSASRHPDRDVLVAGSIGCHIFLDAGSGQREFHLEQKIEQALGNFEHATRCLLKSGVDMIFLEMIQDVEVGPLIVRTVADVVSDLSPSCPLFLGLSTVLQPDGSVSLFNKYRSDQTFTADIMRSFLRIFDECNVPVAGINVMHTPFSSVLPTLKIIRECWQGRIGCYPENDYSYKNDYAFDVLDNSKVSEYCDAWINEGGVTMIGGCCGTGPPFIKWLHETYVGRNSLV